MNILYSTCDYPGKSFWDGICSEMIPWIIMGHVVPYAGMCTLSCSSMPLFCFEGIPGQSSTTGKRKSMQRLAGASVSAKMG